ncbi:arginase family protein [Negadavirga shengliensis]|uniref:Arginase family protein n=1 Tax=Negadavirga shengliensis TaxID=1389218 RepID=A0ABV9T3V4_9BACT
MELINEDIQIISAPSILGLKPTGVEALGDSLLASGLYETLKTQNTVIRLETLNTQYSEKREPRSNLLNALAIKNFSMSLDEVVVNSIDKNNFPFVLGGDCSILIGITSALKAKGNYGLIFLDAHADFYEPEKSITGEVADMDLAIVTGRGPGILTNIHNLQPYIKDENVVHVGQRDWEETRKYGSQDIRETPIKCFSLAEIKRKGINTTTEEILQHINKAEVEGFWIHFDTDVLSDEINPAVDYRLPDGLRFEQVEYLIRSLLKTERMIGISVTIFNPRLDKTGNVSKNITESLGKAFNLETR